MGRAMYAPMVGLDPPHGMNINADGQTHSTHPGHEERPGMSAAQPTKNAMGATALMPDMVMMRVSVTAI